MKKRILSMLLAIVMVATALPLLVFTAMAEEGDTVTYPETTEEEYNALYVTYGRIFQNDFFKTNEHWAPVTHDTPIEITNGGTGITSGVDAVNSFTPYIVYRPNYYYMFTCTTAPGNVTIHDGYVDIPAFGDVDFANSRTTNFSDRNDARGTMAAVNPNYKLTVTVEYVMNVRSAKNSSGAQTSSGQPMFQLGGITIVEGNSESNLVFRQVKDQGVAITDGNLLDGQEHYDRFYAERNKVNTFTLKVDRPQATLASGTELHTENGYLGLMVNGVDYFESSTVKYVNSQANPYQINYVNAYTSVAYYATRVYNHVLNDNEVAQNHFADLAKFFRLDLSAYNEWKEILTTEELYKALSSLSAYTFDNDRADVQAALDTCFEKVVYDDYYAGFEGVVDAHTLAVAMQFSLNLDVFKSMPKVLMPKTTAWFVSIDLKDENLEQTAVQADYIRVVEEDIWDYAGDSVLDAAGYNALYEKTGLVLQYDFFDSNEHWGGDYSDGTRLTWDSTSKMHMTTGWNTSQYRIYSESTGDTHKIGENGVGVGYLPTTGDGYTSFVSTNDFASSSLNGYGSWGRQAGYMMYDAFVDASGNYTYTLQQVSAYTDVLKNNYPQYYLSNVSIYMGTDANGNYYFSGVSDGFKNTVGTDISATSASHAFAPGEVVDYTAVITQPANATIGTFGIYINGNEAYLNNAFAYTNAASSRQGVRHTFWRGLYAANVYAIRYYDTVLDEDTIAKNHFADVAKWYKLGLFGWEDLTAAEKSEIYKAFADITVDDDKYTRAEAEAVYIKAYTTTLNRRYDPLRAEYAAVPQKLAFIELAAEWLLPVDTLEAVVSSKRDMSYVYANVTNETLLAADDAAALLEQAYQNAYTYYCYADDTNSAFLDKAFKLSLDITGVTVLPKSERAEVYALDPETLTQESLNEALAPIMEKYVGAETFDKAFYNALYETTGLVMQYDFFDSNEYWGGNYSNVTEENRLVMGDTSIHMAPETLAPYKQFVLNLSANKLGINGYDNNGVCAFADALPSVGNGYLKLYPKYSGMSHAGSGGFGSWGRSGDTYAGYMMRAGFYKEETYTLSTQYVFSADSVKVGSGQFTLGGVHVALNTVDDDIFCFNTAAQGASATIGTNSFHYGEVVDFTQVIKQTGGATANAGLLGIYLNGVSAYKNDAFAYTTAPASRGIGYHMLWTGNYEGRAYAVRFYNAVLDEDTIARNHFADVAKWYKLDLCGWSDLSDTEKKTVYAAFADITVNDPLYDRAKAQAKYAAAFASAYDYSQLKTGDKEIDAFVDHAALATVSPKTISDVITLPSSLRGDIIASFNEAFAGLYAEDYTHAILAYWIDAIAESEINERYDPFALYTQEDYNKLYAQLDHLTLWFDFFSSTKDVIDKETINSDQGGGAVAIDPTKAPSVFRVGSMQLAGITSNLPATLLDRSMENGYFRMYDNAASGVKYPNVNLVGESNVEVTNFYYSDYTFEMVASDLSGYNQNIQLDGLRWAVGQSGTNVRLGVLTETAPVFSSSTGNVVGSISFSTTAGDTHGAGKYIPGADLGHTFVLRYDKDFTVQPVVYYKVAPTASGDSYTYARAGRTAITKAEAMSILGYIDEAAFDTAIAVPTDALPSGYQSEDEKKGINLNASKFLVAADGTLVYAYRYSAAATYSAHYDLNEFHTQQSVYLAGSWGNGIGTDVNMNVYSMRRYDIVLTDAELAQNHFVDLCKYYGLDITVYLKLDQDGRDAVHTAMKPFLLKDEANYDAMMTAYKSALKAAYYDNLKVDGEDAYNTFIDYAALNNLDLSALLALPASIRTEIGTAGGIGCLAVEREAYIARGLFEEILLEAVPETDPAYLASKLIDFSGYSVRITGSYDTGVEALAGIRSTFVINQELLADLIAVEDGKEPLAITFGAKVTNPANPLKFAKITVYDNGKLPTVIPDGKTAEDYTINGFNFVGNAYTRANAEGVSELCYTYATVYDAMGDTPWAEVDFAKRKAVIEAELIYSWFVTIGEETYEFACESPSFGEAVSAAEVYDYFRNDGEYSADAVIGDIIGTKLGESDVKKLYNIKFNGTSLADMTLVYDYGITKEEAEAVADALYELTGVRMKVVQEGANYYYTYLTPEEKAKTLLITADSFTSQRDWGDRYLGENAYGIFNMAGVTVITANTREDVAGFADALVAYLASQADADGNLDFKVITAHTFAPVAAE